jgi:hypothetical protein
MKKAHPELVIRQIVFMAIRTGKGRGSLFSEYIQKHWRTTGKLAPGCDSRDFYAVLDEINGARQLRLACVTNVYKQGLISEVDAKEILAGRLSPENENTVIDDSTLLGDPGGLGKIKK